MATKEQVRHDRDVSQSFANTTMTFFTDILLRCNDIITAGEVVVDFLVPPSKKGMDLLKNEFDRLEQFGQKREQSFNGEVEVPEYELKSLWEYYDALSGAIRYALESNATLVDDVWAMGDDWWVKDGNLKAEDVDEHCVRPWKENGSDEL